MNTEEDGFIAVRNGTCQALCLDDNLLQYALSLQTSCDVQRVDAIKYVCMLHVSMQYVHSEREVHC